MARRRAAPREAGLERPLPACCSACQDPWPGSAVVVAPPRVLGVASRDGLPLVSLDGREADLDGQLADEVLPALLDEVSENVYVHHNCFLPSH